MKHVAGHIRRDDFTIPADLLSRLDVDSLGALIGLGADIVMLLDDQHFIRHIYLSNQDLADYGLLGFVGKRLEDCVTIESVPKIKTMLARDGHRPSPRGYQVNHEASGKLDLPVVYSAYHADDFPFSIVVGRELRQQMSDQQRLVEAQMELEVDYRELQEAEARYRTAFKISATAHLMLDGEKKSILDANAAAIALFPGSGTSITGKPIRDLFHRMDHDRLIDAVGEARHSPDQVFISPIKSAKGAPLSVGMRSYRENGVTNLILSIWPADSESAEAAPRQEKSTPGPAIELADIPIAAVQTDPDGVVLAANTLFLDLVHAPTFNQVVGRNIGNWFSKAAIDIHLLYARVFEEQFVRGFSSVLTDSLLDERPVSISARVNPTTRTVQLIVVPQIASNERLTIPSPGVPDQAEGFAALVGKVPLKDLMRESLDVIEKICIEAALDKTNNNRAQASEILGLSRQGLYIKLRRHGLEDYRPEA